MSLRTHQKHFNIILKKLSQIVKLRKSENDDEEVKLEAEETIAERVKLNL